MFERQGTPGHGAPHFAVFPDRDRAIAVARALRTPTSEVLAHASGRPWLVGRWREDEITTAQAGDIRLAVIGCCPLTADQLAREAERLDGLDRLDRLARELPGSFHLVAVRDGRLRVQGSASGLRLVFHTRVAGVTVAADRADTLAALTKAPPDEHQLATRLLWPVPHPLSDTPMWHGVSAVPPGDCLLVEADGESARLSTWWRPPSPDRPLVEQAPVIREALATAVDARTRGGGVVSCDLSGGLDSTSICFLAARGESRVIAGTWPGRDPADEDAAWARKAAAHLPEVEHLVWPAERSPLVYADLLDTDDAPDEPTIGVMDRSRALGHLPELAAKGSRVHLTGIGGDHLAWPSEAHYHTLLRRHPIPALRRLRGFRALWDWPRGAMVRGLADGRTYRRWLADAAADLHRPPPAPADTAFSWGMPPRLFDWVTPRAAAAARQVLLESAATARPLAPTRGEHADLEQILACTRVVRQWERMSARAGLPLASPFFDDRVIEACLAVRPEERVTPWTYKPLLRAAMAGVVPDACLARANKAQAALDAASGLREHRGELLALWRNSRLAELGLVDADRLQELAHRPDTPDLQDAILYSTIGCEVWLRTSGAARSAR